MLLSMSGEPAIHGLKIHSLWNSHSLWNFFAAHLAVHSIGLGENKAFFNLNAGIGLTVNSRFRKFTRYEICRSRDSFATNPCSSDCSPILHSLWNSQAKEFFCNPLTGAFNLIHGLRSSQGTKWAGYEILLPPTHAQATVPPFFTAYGTHRLWNSFATHLPAHSIGLVKIKHQINSIF